MIPALNTFAKLFGHGVNFPSVHEARWITENCKHSPDLGWLEQFSHQLLFCVEDLKQGHSHHGLLEGAEFMATAYSANKYNYWTMEAGPDRIPVPLDWNGKPHLIAKYAPPLKVKGELRLVRSPLFKELDNYKRNTVQFRRKRVTVFVPWKDLWYIENKIDPRDQPVLFRPRELPRVLQGNLHPVLSAERMCTIRAYMYVGKDDYWNDIISEFRGFKPVNYYESKRAWLKEYYDYPSVPI